MVVARNAHTARRVNKRELRQRQEGIADAAAFKLTPRWEELRVHPIQEARWQSSARFIVNPAGRRSGKTEFAKRKIIFRALMGTEFPRPRFFAGAPTRDQAKRIYWEDLKAMVPREFIKSVSESELVLRLVNMAEIHVIGLDKPERIEGSPWDGGVLDEFANMKANAWMANVRPALSDRQGWCDFVGVPEGRNHFYELYKSAQERKSDEWATFHWVSADILPESEVESARADLDPLTFQQEYEASFINFMGQAYYCFNERDHLHETHYNPAGDLAFCFDFNVSPGVAVVLQEQSLPASGGRKAFTGTCVLDEVYIPRNSNTVAVCNSLINKWAGVHNGPTYIYGDATGGSRGTAQTEGSDWEIVEQTLRPKFDIRMRVPSFNPTERSRVNSLNSRCKSTASEIRLRVNPQTAPYLTRDLEGVRLLEGGSGELDKRSDPELSHISDALGYYVVAEYPIAGDRMTLGQMSWV
jgi:hypothetical protein